MLAVRGDVVEERRAQALGEVFAHQAQREDGRQSGGLVEILARRPGTRPVVVCAVVDAVQDLLFVRREGCARWRGGRTRSMISTGKVGR